MNSLEHARALARSGRLDEAEAACERLCAAGPTRLGALALLAEICLDAGRAESALGPLEEIARLQPSDAANLRRLGGALVSLGRTARAAEVLALAVAAEPGNVRGHNNLGQALLALRRLPEALACFSRALALDAGYLIARFNLGVALELAGRGTEALREYAAVTSVSPGHQAGWARRGALEWRLGRPAAALASLDRAIALRSDDAGSQALRAGALLALGRGAEALAAADQALALAPACIEALQFRSAALCQLDREEEALACLTRAAELAPGDPELRCNRAALLQRGGESEAARACYVAALQLDPGSVRARAGILETCVPAVPDTVQDVQRGRAAFECALGDFESWMSGLELHASDAWTLAQQPFFYLSYHEHENRTLLERYRRLSSAALARCQPESIPARNAFVSERRRIRVGFASAHVHDHSVFRALTQGWIEQLDRNCFETSVFHLGRCHDAATQRARRAVDHFHAEARSLPEWARALADARLDVLIYPEIGIDRGTIALASRRLAPRQMVSWGHPETSGLPTVDDYISADALEPADAESHYSERLIRLPGLGVYIEPELPEPPTLDCASLGLPAECPWFVCAGTPFKYHPAHDPVWIDVARRVPGAVLVFFEYERRTLSARLRRRLESQFAAAGLDPGARLRWLPWQDRGAFRALLRQATAYLDTIGFSGFNTLWMAVEAGLPCVTMEGPYLRGRLGSGILRTLGCPELVAAGPADYVDVAVRLGSDANYRRAISERLRASVPGACRDARAVRGLERHLMAVLQGAVLSSG